MTGDPDEQPHRHRSERPLRWRIAAPAVVLLSGCLFAVSAADSGANGGNALSTRHYTDLAGLADADRADVERMEKHRQGLEDEVRELTGSVKGSDIRRLQRRAEDLQDPAGLTPRSGAGIVVTLSDSPDDVFEAADDAGAKYLNELIVHQQDIQAVVNAMWAGGATAVTIAGQRVVSTSGIKCEGSVVQIHGLPYPQPYVIEAVGDPDVLESAVEADPWVAGYIASSDDPARQIGWSLTQDDDIDAPAYEGGTARRYAEPID